MISVLFTVPQSHCVSIERFGKFSRIARQGLRFRIPFIESVRILDGWGTVANKQGYFIELAEQQTDTPPRQCHTKDNVTIEANASVYWRITDPVRALYEVDELPRSVHDLALNALRANIGSLDLDTILSQRQRLNDQIAAQLSATAVKWGVQFTRVEIQELRTSDATEAAMRQQMEAERRQRATIADSEGKAQAEVRTAKAEAEATVLRAKARAMAIRAIAEAEAEYLTRLSESIGAAEASRLLIAQKFLDGLERISQNPADKVFLPNGFQALLSMTAEAPNGHRGA